MTACRGSLILVLAAVAQLLLPLGFCDSSIKAEPEPWAYWQLSSENARNNTVPDDGKRFNGFMADGEECAVRPCTWHSEGVDGATATAFNPGGFIVVPSVYLPHSTNFSVELLFSPACRTTNKSATQGLMRFLNESSVFSPRLLLLRGRLVSFWGLQDARDNSSYLSEIHELRSTADTWDAGVWTHVAEVMNSTALMLYINGAPRPRTAPACPPPR